MVASSPASLAVVVALLGAGCVEPADTAAGSGADTGGSPAVNPGERVYAVLPEEGLVTRYDPATGVVDTLDVGGFPSRIIRFGGRMVASLRSERGLAVLDETGGGLALAEVVPTGAEPVGMAASADGERLYVALYGGEEVREYDADFTVLRSFAVPGRPEWVALHPSGDTLIVGSQVGGTVSALNLREAAPTAVALEIPELYGGGPGGENLKYSRRVTGSPAYDPAGTALAAPLLYVDNTALPNHKTEEEALEQDPAARYEKLGLGLGPNNPVVAFWSVDASGMPTTDVTQLYATGNAAIDDIGAVQAVRSFLAGITFSPDGAELLAPMEGSRVVVAMATDPTRFVEYGQGLYRAPSTYVGTGAEGPRGLTFTEDGRIWATHMIDRSLVELPVDQLVAGIEAQLDAGTIAETSAVVASAAPVVLAAPALDDQVLYGQTLFNSALNPLITTPLSGVSCSTCHFETRNDGLGWMEVDGVLRQTLSLAGPLTETPPYTWNNGVQAVAEEVRITSQVRIGGRNATDTEYDAVAAFLDLTRSIDHTNAGRTGADVDRGRALFERGDVGCVNCHSPPYYTDQSTHDLYGLTGVDTPSLIGVESTAPYLHDGSAPTLRAVLEGTTEHHMGDAAALSDAELTDLEAYLRTL
jgi:DNA-binding beta-propeller fold protein YncE